MPELARRRGAPFHHHPALPARGRRPSRRARGEMERHTVQPRAAASLLVAQQLSCALGGVEWDDGRDGLSRQPQPLARAEQRHAQQRITVLEGDSVAPLGECLGRQP